MKNLILFIALLTLTKPLWPVVEYVINYDFIVATLCENRDKPEMHCDGKCYLTKQLAQESESADKNPLNDKLAKTDIPQNIIAEIVSGFHFESEAEFSKNITTKYSSNLFPSLFVMEIPHPPRQLSLPSLFSAA